MATGPEHYREAEDWLTVADKAVGKSSEHVVMAAAVAQAHATLALAAATALASTGVGEADMGEWTAMICLSDEDYDEPLTNADVLSADELYEDERAAEFHLDAIEEERNAALAEAEPYDDDAGYEYEHEDGYKDEDGEL